jgi:hypothetical protein
VIDQLLLFLDNKIVGEADYDQAELVNIGHYMNFLQEVTAVLKKCIETSDYSLIVGCRIDAFLNQSLELFTVNSYINSRGNAFGRSTY